MNTKFLPLMVAIAAVLATAGPAMAQHSGGGHGGGGGGHSGGGGHAAGMGGGHGYGGAHAAGGHAYAAAYGGHGYSGGAHTIASAQHFAPGYHGAVGGVHGAYGYGGYGRGGYSSGAYWRGGYWRGGFWPRAYYGLGFAWFLPILPLAYATYWWDGIPYYYANDVYYTWSPAYEGYVATDPPPVAETAASEGASPEGQGVTGVGAQVFMYPKNGQSAEQQSTDRRECQDWAAHQAGTDGSHGDDYRRAMLACVEGRGYSAK
jgi:hypothetical protein